MNRGDDPAFPSHRGGTQPEPGISIREYVSLELLGALIVAEGRIDMTSIPMKFFVKAAFDSADLWLAEREKRTQVKT